MLVYFLAFLVGLGSFALYMGAFFLPEVHRQNDFVWSGVGLFYALALWVYGERITGGVLLGQMACVTLLGWLGWQTLTMRRQLADPDQQTPLPTVDELKAGLDVLGSEEGRSQFLDQASRTFNQVKSGVQGVITTSQSKEQGRGKETSVTMDEPYVPPSLEEFGTAGREATERFAKAAIAEIETARQKVSDKASERRRDRIRQNSSGSPSKNLSDKTYPKASETVEAALAEAEAAIEDVVQGVSQEAEQPVADGSPTERSQTDRLPAVKPEQPRGARSPSAKTAVPINTPESIVSRSAVSGRAVPERAISVKTVPTSNMAQKTAPFQSQTPDTGMAAKSTNPIQAIAATVQGLLKGLTKKPDQKPVYVRKQYREEAREEAFGAEETQTSDRAPIDAKLEKTTVEEIVEDLLEDISAQESAADK